MEKDFRRLKALSEEAVKMLSHMDSIIHELPDKYMVTEVLDPKVFRIIYDTINCLYEFDKLYEALREPFKKQVDRVHEELDGKPRET